jgi:hypothetical protein
VKKKVARREKFLVFFKKNSKIIAGIVVKKIAPVIIGCRIRIAFNIEKV